ncbi:MAG: endolytic transglycosylase MltG [Candidatus Tectimicrobiota bacterium]
MAHRFWHHLRHRHPRAVIAIPLVLLVAAVVGLGGLYHAVSSPASLPAEERAVVILNGASLPTIARQLAEAGLVRSPWRFRLAARLAGAATKLQAGEYRLSTGMSPRELSRHLLEGRTVEVTVTVPEGLTVREVAASLAAAGLAEADTVEQLASDRAFIASLPLEAPTLEGYLHPETYRFRKGVDARTIVASMVAATMAIFDEAALERASVAGLTVHEVLTLASIVERETALAAERPRIAAVFLNRLRRGIPLQADPTVIYALGPRFDGNLTRAHLTLESPYNTYRHPGLPPTPIANPGRASIDAVLRPADVEDLYFVAKPDGSHHFSATVRDHERAVRRFQRRRR